MINPEQTKCSFVYFIHVKLAFGDIGRVVVNQNIHERLDSFYAKEKTMEHDVQNLVTRIRG